MKRGICVFVILATLVALSGRPAAGAIEIVSQSISTSVAAIANDISERGVYLAGASSAPSGGIPGIVNAWGTISFENTMGPLNPWDMYPPPCSLLSSYFHSWEVLSISRDSLLAGFDIASVTATAYSSVTFQVTDPVSVHLLSSYDLMGANPENSWASNELGYGGRLVGPGMLVNITENVSDRAVTLPVGMYTLSSWLNTRAEQVAVAYYSDCDLSNLFDAKFSVGISLPEGTEVTVIPEPTTIIIWSLLGGLVITVGWRRRKAA
jgi:hypothetical protein